jgi:hypothetical protein
LEHGRQNRYQLGVALITIVAVVADAAAAANSR